MWQSVIGAALNGYHIAGGGLGCEPEHTSNILCLAKKYKSSRQILSAVADYLDSIYGYVIFQMIPYNSQRPSDFTVFFCLLQSIVACLTLQL